jgi:acylphosphatase
VQRITVLVSGQVQGVGYRHFTRKKASELDLAGYVENLPDGRVEVVAEGDRADLEQLIHHLRQGPRGARVHQVDVQWSEAAHLKGFQIF